MDLRSSQALNLKVVHRPMEIHSNQVMVKVEASSISGVLNLMLLFILLYTL